MDRDRILELADFVERCELEFDMCMPFAGPRHGLAGCIVGHAALLWPDLAEGKELETVSIENEVLEERLDVNGETLMDLCYPAPANHGDLDYLAVTRERAVAVLRHLADTGEVDWTVGG